MSNDAKNVYVRDQIFLAGVALSVLGSMALFFLLISWLIGGDAFMASLYGKESIVALLVAIGAGAGLMLAFRGNPVAKTTPAALCASRSAAS